MRASSILKLWSNSLPLKAIPRQNRQKWIRDAEFADSFLVGKKATSINEKPYIVIPYKSPMAKMIRMFDPWKRIN
jgi:hypothetical protein